MKSVTPKKKQPVKARFKAVSGYSNASQLSYINDNDVEAAGLIFGNQTPDPYEFPVTVIPCSTLKEARQRVRFERMAWEKKLAFAGAQLFHPLADYARAKYPDEVREAQAAALLTAIGITKPANDAGREEGKK